MLVPHTVLTTVHIEIFYLSKVKRVYLCMALNVVISTFILGSLIQDVYNARRCEILLRHLGDRLNNNQHDCRSQSPFAKAACQVAVVMLVYTLALVLMH